MTLRLVVRAGWACFGALLRMIRAPQNRLEKMETEVTRPDAGQIRRRVKNKQLPAGISTLKKPELIELLKEWNVKDPEKMSTGAIKDVLYNIPAAARKGEWTLNVLKVAGSAPRGAAASGVAASSNQPGLDYIKKIKDTKHQSTKQYKQLSNSDKENPLEDKTMRVGKFKSMRFSHIMFNHPEYCEWCVKASTKEGTMADDELLRFTRYINAVAEKNASEVEAVIEEESDYEPSNYSDGYEEADEEWSVAGSSV